MFEEIKKSIEQVEKGKPIIQLMSKSDFMTYAQEQVNLAKGEEPTLATKRMDALKAEISRLEKMNWESTESKSVTVFQMPTTNASAQTSTTISDQSGQGTQADVSISMAKAMEILNKADKALAEPETTDVKKADTEAPKNRVVDWPSDFSDEAYKKDGTISRGGQWGVDPLELAPLSD